jgi:imidazolonepropionase-like amidohydrolase
MMAGRQARKHLGTGALSTVLLYVVLAAVVGQVESAKPASSARSFVIRAKTVYPVTPDQPGPIDRGMIVVRDGRIEAVGRDLPVPPDLPLLDLRDEVVCPGFVSAGSCLVSPHTGPESVSGAYHAADAFDTYDDYEEVLARGTTTAHLSPGEHRLVSGVGAVVKLAGSPHTRTLKPAADLTITLGVFGPPLLFKPPFYASSDVPIEPARRQRPDSRLGQFLELEERIAGGAGVSPAKFDIHSYAFNEAWAAGLPLRIEAERATDIEGALQFLHRLEAGATGKRAAYLVGLTEIDRVVAAAHPEVPLVLRVERDYRAPGGNIGGDPEAPEPSLNTAAHLAELAPALRFALAGETGDRREDLRMAAILAVRGGLAPERALAAITRVPAEILGVDDRVGSLAPGKDADLLVLSGEPLDINSFARQAYVSGQLAFSSPPPSGPAHAAAKKETGIPPPLVIRAGTIWVGDGTLIRDGSLLIENRKIQAVGQRVPHPPFARIIDAGPDAFLAPGFIDAYGHLGLENDNTVAGPDLPVHRSVAVAGREFLRVARAGVTTVLQAPYRGAPNGAQMAAIKTFGCDRDQLIAREVAGLKFSLRGQDPLTASEALRKVFQAAKKYDDDWKKYETDLAKWKEAGGKPTTKPAEGGETVEQGRPDPVTGKWEYTIQGGPLPEPVSGWVLLRLTGTSIEGRIFDPMSGEESRVSGSLHGNDITLEVDVDTPVGKPTIRATIDREDHAVGRVTLGEYSLEFQATRVDKTAVEFKVQRAQRSKDGRPMPPKLDPNLEPFRPLLAGKIPAVVDVETAAQINTAVKLFTDELKLPLVLLGAEGAVDIADQLLARKAGAATTTAPASEPTIGVVAPREIEQVRARRPYCQAADLSRRGIRVALQSDSEDGARDLPLMGLFAVRAGLGGDAALKALTIDAARMYKLDDRIGALEPGRDGDVLIFHGYPFDTGSRLERVIVGGQEVPDE